MNENFRLGLVTCASLIVLTACQDRKEPTFSSTPEDEKMVTADGMCTAKFENRMSNLATRSDAHKKSMEKMGKDVKSEKIPTIEAGSLLRLANQTTRACD